MADDKIVSAKEIAIAATKKLEEACIHIQRLLDEIASLRAQLVSCEGQWRKEVDANTVTRAQLAEAREKP